ncbi:MAG TPA: 7-cyano-7-deazaguanine synthase [Chroococcales cyanobacterium]
MAKPSSSATLLFPDSWTETDIETNKIVVLTSGGVESTIMAGLLPTRCRTVQPIYVRFGLLWEEAELFHLRRYLHAVSHPHLQELKVLSMPIDDLYQNHWSTTGKDVPDASTDDTAVYLPGRNILLTAKAAVWCALNGYSALALGSLSTNPFPDATDEFVKGLEASYSLGLAEKVDIIRPVVHLHKEEALKMAAHLPLELSFSCIRPQVRTTDHEPIHCGTCNKCEERRQAFALVEFDDKTVYATTATNPHSTAVNNLCIK